MECPSCFDFFNEQERVPRNLQCGHTFCEKCLIVLETSRKFSCPICRKQNPPYSAQHLPKNYIALQLCIYKILH